MVPAPARFRSRPAHLPCCCHLRAANLVASPVSIVHHPARLAGHRRIRVPDHPALRQPQSDPQHPCHPEGEILTCPADGARGISEPRASGQSSDRRQSPLICTPQTVVPRHSDRRRLPIPTETPTTRSCHRCAQYLSAGASGLPTPLWKSVRPNSGPRDVLAKLVNFRYCRGGGASAPTRNINLTEHFDHFIERGVASGEFQNASEVVRAGLRLLERQQREERARLEALREAARLGFEQLDRGEGVVVPAHELGDFIRRLGEGAARQTEQQGP